MIQFIKYFLFPFSLIYKGITSLRNVLFELRILPSFEPTKPTIGVGNLAAGGTGKTPIIDYLISIFPKNNIGIISRGYGRKTKGFIEITQESNSQTVGDEPFMLYSKNKNQHFFVSENRVEGYEKALRKYPNIDLLLFDDVYQHRYLKPKVNILLCDFNRPFYEDYVLPTGYLRESRYGAKRASIIVVTKCPVTITDIDKKDIVDKIHRYTIAKNPIFFASFESIVPQNGFGIDLKLKSSVVIISGLANNFGFRKGLESDFHIQYHFQFKDHYNYSKNDIETFFNSFPESNFVCTEKDFVKIKPLLDPNLLKFFYISTQKVNLFEEDAFKKLILQLL